MKIKNAKKIALIGLATFGLLGLIVINSSTLAVAYNANDAANQLCPNPGSADCPITTPEGIFNILKTVVQWTYTIFFVVAVLFILLAAYTFLTAKDDPGKIKSATNQIFWAAVAIAIALIAVGATQIIQKIINPSI